MRKLMAALAVTGLLFAGVACDDAEPGTCGEKVDEDDCRVGPGDGKDEFGPGR